MVPDTVDYGEYVTHHRAEGLVYSGASFATKVANGIGTVLAGFVINLGGYVNNAETQTDTALSAILFASSGVPVIVFAIGFAILYFYRLDDELPEVVRTLKERHTQNQTGGLTDEEKAIIARTTNPQDHSKETPSS